MAKQNEPALETRFPHQAYKAGFWLIAALPLAVVIMFPLNAWIHRQSVVNMIGLPLVALAFAGTAYQWANALVRRSGWNASWRTGLAGAVGLIITTLGVEFGGFELLFDSILGALHIPQTVGGSHAEFYVVFVVWTGIVTGGCGFAVGLALKQRELALKLLGMGLICGATVFFLVARAMELFGFRVGTPRPDGLPSMPIVTLLGIWLTALAGSELFGRVIARHKIHPE